MSTTIDMDRNLLFAVIALQDDLIDQSQFADVCAGWALRMELPLAELLVDRGWVSAEDRAAIERRMERKLKKNKGDIRATLGAVAEVEARDLLQEIKSPEIKQTMGALPPARGHVLIETIVPPSAQNDTLRYTLTRLHAEGGLGKVWIARDGDLNREVALKEIKPTTAANPDAWRRFLKEAQITGQLEHPNIVPVYELTRRKQDDQPFYTMRFVRGQSLGGAIAEFHRRRAGKPAERLELQRQLLEPFIKVCQAVGYAHSRGVIHRDLKPDNVVLGGHGEVVLLDWGLAKVLGEPEGEGKQTVEPRVSLSLDAAGEATHGQLGTPAYMAPEQVRARHDLVDTRTDIYGLGAILFEILTNQPPASGKTLGEVFQKIEWGRIPKAREIDPTVSKRLEAICVKALDPEPSKRYQRAEDLAEDVRRWTVDEPVSVFVDSLPVRVIRWARKHKTLVSSLGALMMTALVGLSVGLVLIDRERSHTEEQRKIAVEQKKVALEQREIAVTNADRALGNLRLAQDAADGLLGEVADVDLADIPWMEAVRRRLLEKATSDYRQFLSQKGDDPLVRWGSGRSLVRLGDIDALLGDAAKAESNYKQAITELGALAKEDPSNPDYRRDLARANLGLGVLLKEANRYQQGEQVIREAIQLLEQLALGQDSAGIDTQALADCRYQLGAVLARRGSLRAEDAQAYRSALEVQEGLIRKYGNRPDYRNRLARYRNNLAILLRAVGKTGEAISMLRETLEMLASSVDGSHALPAPRWQYARAANNLGTLLLGNENVEAGKQLQKSRDLLQTLAAEFPDIAQYSQELASAHFNLALLAQATGQLGEAATAFGEARKILEGLRARYPGVPAYRLKLAAAYSAVNDALAATSPAESEATIRKAVRELSALQIDFPEVPEYKANLGRAHYQLGRLLVKRQEAKEAVRQLEAAIELHKKVLEARPDSELDRRNLLDDQGVLCHALLAEGRPRDAADLAEQMPASSPRNANTYLHAAALLVRCADAVRKDPALAEDCQARAVRMLVQAARANLIRSPAAMDTPEFLPLKDREDFKRLKNSLLQPPRSG